MKSLKRYLPIYHPVEPVVFNFRFTVFVPVYNAEKTIARVFQSLGNQTFKNFEVIMINDGSTDRSHEVIESLIGESPLKIRYLNNRRNKHKMGILYEAIGLAKGEFFIVHDSDDEVDPAALSVLDSEYEMIPESEKPMITGVTCCCKDQHGRRIGNAFARDPFYCTAFHFRNYTGYFGEKWGFNKTIILKGIRINEEIFGRGLIPESFLWDTLSSEGFQIRYINAMLRTYHMGTENNLSSLNYEKKAFGMALYSLLYLNRFHAGHVYRIPLNFLKRTYSLLKASNYLPYNFAIYLNSVDNYVIKGVVLLTWPFRRLL